MTYNSRAPRGVVLRYAAQPWGPWSDAIVIFNAERDGGYGGFIHDTRITPEDGLAGSVAGGQDQARVVGGEYAPYIIERFTEIQPGRCNLHYLMSTWNPYTVVRIRSTLTEAR